MENIRLFLLYNRNNRFYNNI